MAVLPAALAYAGNSRLRRCRGAVAWAALAAAAVCRLGFLALVATFFLTVPPEFF